MAALLVLAIERLLPSPGALPSPILAATHTCFMVLGTLLHRKEGDLDNAGYWHARAGSTLPQTTLEQEWEELAVILLDKETK
jgi:hypothetical protein